MIKVTDINRDQIYQIYINRILKDNNIDPIKDLFIYQRLSNQKRILSNEILQQEILSLYPDMLENLEFYPEILTN